MKFGCIGEHLPHSFSCEIHEKLGAYAYELRELAPDALEGFLLARDFSGINVTIPYKQRVIPFCAALDETARAVGAVNTVVNRGGRLFGYNTDFGGLKALILRLGLDFSGRKVLILGTGGTGKTAFAVASALGAAQIVRVSRTPSAQAVSYAQAYEAHRDADFILNTTPVGMYPHPEGLPIRPADFPNLRGVADAVYNPLRTRLVQEARALGIPAAGGLYMLVHQAVAASAIFTGNAPDEALTERIFAELHREKENIVLIGMPGSGKTTLGRMLAARTGREFADADAELVRQCGIPIPEFFSRFGEEAFRARETAVLRALSQKHHAVIATGGGAVLRAENVQMLRQNGRLIFLDRAPERLLPSADRPLAASAEALRKRYAERYGLYRRAADIILPNNGTPEEGAAQIERMISE